jgi:ribosomal-protein-alanine N-acetyltransferase
MSESPPKHPARRIDLRNPTADDRARFLDAVRVSGELHDPWLLAPATPTQYDSYARRVSQDPVAGFLAYRRSDDALVGYLTLGHIVRDALQSAYVSYAAFSPHAGHGYMTEALELVLAEAFVRMRLHRVEANIQPENGPSQGLVKRCGFQYEGFSPRYLKIGGEWRDHQRWAIRAETWTNPLDLST